MPNEPSARFRRTTAVAVVAAMTGTIYLVFGRFRPWALERCIAWGILALLLSLVIVAAVQRRGRATVARAAAFALCAILLAGTVQIGDGWLDIGGAASPSQACRTGKRPAPSGRIRNNTSHRSFGGTSRGRWSRRTAGRVSFSRRQDFSLGFAGPCYGSADLGATAVQAGPKC